MHPLLLVLLGLLLCACNDDLAPVPSTSEDTTSPPSTDTSMVSDAGDDAHDGQDTTTEDLSTLFPDLQFGQVGVLVLLDGVPAPATHVMQGGARLGQYTDDRGRTIVTLDPAVEAPTVIASHPDARQRAKEIDTTPTTVTIELTRLNPADNVDYFFQDSGVPGDRENTQYCGHCHITFNDSWFASPHRSAASNPTVHDVYAGTSAALNNPVACLSAGGRWDVGVEPGTGQRVMQCYTGVGVLPSLNPQCDDASVCADVADEFGGCANCHAPAINGTLGGRDLLEARGIAYEQGVSCDVCHRVADIDLEAEPGVAGALQLHRPSEPSPSRALGVWWPLTFGPSHDIPNPRMGSVQRDHFREATLCAGCHEYRQEVLVPDASLDAQRWPEGSLPIHSTYSEWREGPMNPAAPCQSCHMPPAADLANGADLQRYPDEEIGIAGGWVRPPGETRHHSWLGPRQPESRMLQLAAAIFIDKRVDDRTLTANITVKNVGPGHAIPTGTPLRSLVLLVQARCGDRVLTPTGGDVVPDFGGYLARKIEGDDWTRWSNAQPGQKIRVVRRTNAFHDYNGFGPFATNGRFDAAAKGMPVEAFVAEARIVDVINDRVVLDQLLPDGDVAYLVDDASWPAANDTASPWAGAPGFAFARVMVGPDGARMVPSFMAVDIASDNRLLPQESWTSTHRFATSCAAPTVDAMLIHRAFPFDLARQRRWTLNESVMVEVSR